MQGGTPKAEAMPWGPSPWVLGLLVLAVVLPSAAQAQGPALAADRTFLVEGESVTLTFSNLGGAALHVVTPRGQDFATTPTSPSGTVRFPDDFPGAKTNWAGTYTARVGATATGATFQVGLVAGGPLIAKGSLVHIEATGYNPNTAVTLRILDGTAQPIPDFVHPLHDGVLVTADGQGRVAHDARIPHVLPNGTYLLEWVAGGATPGKAEPDRWQVQLQPAQVTPAAVSASAGSVARLGAIDYRVQVSYGDGDTRGDEFPTGLRLRATFNGGTTADLAASPVPGSPNVLAARFEPGKDAPTGPATVAIVDQADRFGNHVHAVTLGTIDVVATTLQSHLSGSTQTLARMEPRSFELTYTYTNGASGRVADVDPALRLVQGPTTVATCAAMSPVCNLVPSTDGTRWNVTFAAPRDLALTGGLQLQVIAGTDHYGNAVLGAISAPIPITAAALRLGFSHAAPTGVTDAYLRGDSIQAQGTIEYPNGIDLSANDVAQGGQVDLFIQRSDGTLRSAPIALANGLWQGSFRVDAIDPPGPAQLEFRARDRWGNLGATSAPTVLGLVVDLDVLPSRTIAAVARGEAIDATASVRGPGGTPVTLSATPRASLWREGAQVGADQEMQVLGGGVFKAVFPTTLAFAVGTYDVHVDAASTSNEPGLGRGAVEVRASPLSVSNLTVDKQLLQRGQTVVARFNVSSLTGAPVAAGNTTPVARVERTAVVAGNLTATPVATLVLRKESKGWSTPWTPSNDTPLGTYRIVVNGTDNHGNAILASTKSVEVVAGILDFGRFAVERSAYARLDTAVLSVEARDPNGHPIDLRNRTVQLLRPTGDTTDLALTSLGNGTYRAVYRFGLRDPLTSPAQPGYRFRLPAGAFVDGAGNAGPSQDLVSAFVSLTGTYITALPSANHTTVADSVLTLRFTARYLDGTPVPPELGPGAVSWVRVMAGNRSYTVDQVRYEATTSEWVATWTRPAGLVGDVRFVISGTDSAGNRLVTWEGNAISFGPLPAKGRDSPAPVAMATALLLLGLAHARRRRDRL